MHSEALQRSLFSEAGSIWVPSDVRLHPTPQSTASDWYWISFWSHAQRRGHPNHPNKQKARPPGTLRPAGSCSRPCARKNSKYINALKASGIEGTRQFPGASKRPAALKITPPTHRSKTIVVIAASASGGCESRPKMMNEVGLTSSSHLCKGERTTSASN